MLKFFFERRLNYMDGIGALTAAYFYRNDHLVLGIASFVVFMALSLMGETLLENSNGKK